MNRDNTQSIVALEALRAAYYTNGWRTDTGICDIALSTLRATHAAPPTQPAREPDAKLTLDTGVRGTPFLWHGTAESLAAVYSRLLGNRRSVKLHVFVVEDDNA